MRVAQLLFTSLTLMVCAAPGCESKAPRREAALKFGQQISVTMENLRKIGFDWGVTVGKNLRNPEFLEKANAKVTKDLAWAIEDGRRIQPPDDPESRELHRVFNECLNSQEKVIKDEFPKLTQLLVQGNMDGFKSAMKELEQSETGFRQRLNEAQAKFAKAFDILIR